MTTDSSSKIVINERNPHRIRLIVFRVLATLAGLFFLVAVCLHLPAPWVLLQTDEPHPEPNRWFITVSGAVDVIAAGALLALAHRPRRVLLAAEMSLAVIIAGAVIIPFDPTFAAILAIVILPLVCYPYWRDVRAFPRWWANTPPMAIVLAVVAAAALLVTAEIALPRQITGTDVAAQANWWSDYAEHATVFAMAGLLAVSRGPGWRILATLCSAVWLYLGLVAALVLPHHTGSWGRSGGALAVLIGAGFAVVARIPGVPSRRLTRRGSASGLGGTPRRNRVRRRRGVGTLSDAGPARGHYRRPIGPADQATVSTAARIFGHSEIRQHVLGRARRGRAQEDDRGTQEAQCGRPRPRAPEQAGLGDLE